MALHIIAAIASGIAAIADLTLLALMWKWYIKKDKK